MPGVTRAHNQAQSGTPSWIQTSGLLLRRQLLYSTELWAHKMVPPARIELATPGLGNPSSNPTEVWGHY